MGMRVLEGEQTLVRIFLGHWIEPAHHEPVLPEA